MFADSPFSAAAFSALGNVSVSVAVTGVNATSALGTATVTADANINVTGVFATGVIDSGYSVIADANVSVTGLAGTTGLGTVAVSADAITSVTGEAGTTTLGSVSVIEGSGVSFSVTGVSATGILGDETVTADANAYPTGVAGTTGLGTADVVGDAIVSVTGVEGTSAVGTVQIKFDVEVNVTGVEGTGLISSQGSTFTADGNAQLSTAQAKFGPSSLLLDGTDDFVVSDENINLSSDDFTIDLWIRPDNVTGYKGIWQSGTSTTEQSYLLGNQVYWSVNPSTIISSSVTVNANEWTMLSYERQGNTHRLYKNGTLEDTASTANKQDNGPFSVGKNGFGDFDGYIDEVRLSSVARYAGSSFTEPTSSYAVDSNTTALLHFDGTNGSTNIVNETTSGITDVTADANVSVTGLAGTTGLGSATVIEGTGVSVPVTGDAGTSALGSVTVVEGTGVSVNVTGNAGTTGLGSATVTADANVPISLTPRLRSGLGNVTVVEGSGTTVNVTGVEAQGQTNVFTLVWGEIDTNQTPNWTDVTTTQTPNWTEIAA